MRNFLAALVCAACVACAHNSDLPVVKPDQPSPAASEQECVARSGNWGFHGATEVPGPFCALPTTDAGKSCTDFSDCQGHCLAADQALPGKRAIGTCAPSYYPGACFNMVEDGKASGLICN